MKYGPLREYLQALPASKQSVTLSFAEIERILGAKLPKSASDYQEWWANQDYGVQAAAWRGAGFRAENVNVGRKTVGFRREDAPPSKTPKTKKPKSKKRAESKPIPAKSLLDAGFQKFGAWELRGDRIALIGDIPAEPGVYAHVVDGAVYYIGSATMGLKKRLYFYGKPGKTQATSIRVNALIKDELAKGRTVELIAALPEPTSWNGLPVDRITGLETGLIKAHCPPWNKRGVAG